MNPDSERRVGYSEYVDAEKSEKMEVDKHQKKDWQYLRV